VNVGALGAETGGAFGGEKEMGGAGNLAPTHGKAPCAVKPTASAGAKIPLFQGIMFEVE